MNAVEIEEAISEFAEQPFDAQEFPFAFLEAFGNKATTLKRLRSGVSNKSDLGGVDKFSSCIRLWCEGRPTAHHDADLCAQMDWQCLDQPEHFIVS